MVENGDVTPTSNYACSEQVEGHYLEGHAEVFRDFHRPSPKNSEATRFMFGAPSVMLRRTRCRCVDVPMIPKAPATPQVDSVSQPRRHNKILGSTSMMIWLLGSLAGGAGATLCRMGVMILVVVDRVIGKCGGGGSQHHMLSEGHPTEHHMKAQSLGQPQKPNGVRSSLL